MVCEVVFVEGRPTFAPVLPALTFAAGLTPTAFFVVVGFATALGFTTVGLAIGTFLTTGVVF